MSKGKYVVSFFFFTLFIFPICGVAVTFNPLILEKTYEVNTNRDGYTELINQDLTIAPVKINNEFVNQSGTELIEGYGNHTQIEEWNSINEPYHYLTEALSVPNKGVKSNVEFNPQDDLYPILYEETVNGSYESLKFIHYSATGYKGDLKPSTAWYQFPEEMTIGEISFCVMIHTNVSKSGEPGARFEFNLDNVAGNSKMVEGYFDINGSGSDVYNIRAYVYPNGNSTGALASEPIEVYTGNDNLFNWINVKIFFDTWNDLYNISFQQYGTDWKFIEANPVSKLIYGDQHTADFSARTRTGSRLSPSHLLDKLEFNLISDAKQYSSYAWIDNLTYKYYEFPAIYADIIYDNATYRLNPEPKRWLNRSIILSYGPPKYPNFTTTNFNFASGYYRVKESMEYLNIWENAPTWMYSIPLAIPSDDSTIVRKTIEMLLNNTEIPLEERGVLKAGVSTNYFQGVLGPFNTMGWEFDAENSTNYVFYFNSLDTGYKIKIAYTQNSKLGMFEQFKMFKGQDDRAPGYIEYWVETILLVPGYSPFEIISIICVASLALWFGIKKRIQSM